MSVGPTAVRGRILAYRVFDAGDTIAVESAQKRLGARRVDMGGPLAEGLVIADRPIELPMDDCCIEIARGGVKLPPLDAKVIAHIYDFGAVAIVYELPLGPTAGPVSFADLTPLCDALYDAPELEAIGRKHRAELIEKLGACVEKPHDWAEAETFTIVMLEEVAGATLSDLAHSEAVAKLLIGETSEKPLAPSVREDVLKNAFSYLADDLVIVDWNSALVVEPTGSRIVPNVLELATCQLLEFRYYDGLLDRELGRVYDLVGRRRSSILRSPFGRLTREVLRRFMELTEFTERVDNAIKLLGDFYLARVYSSAIGRFRVPAWRESVESKLALVGRAYEMLKGDVETSRSQLLEVIVILLIVVELITAIRGH